MTPEDLKAKLGIDDVSVSLSENGGYFNVFVTRDKDGHRHRFVGHLPLDASDASITGLAQDIGSWWKQAGIQY